RIDGELKNSDALWAAPPQRVTVPPGTESLQIDYASLNLSAPDKGRFKYRLENFETVWTEREGTVRFARYPRLPPGQFTFQVAACNEDGVWNERGASLAITVLPPFWRTWWFLTASTVCILGMIIGLVHYASTQKLHRQLESLRQR